MKTGNFLTGMIAGAVVGSAASLLMSQTNPQAVKQMGKSAKKAVNSAAHNISSMM